MRVHAHGETIMEMPPIGRRHIEQSAGAAFQVIQMRKGALCSGRTARGEQNIGTRNNARNGCPWTCFDRVDAIAVKANAFGHNVVGCGGVLQIDNLGHRNVLMSCDMLRTR